MKITGKTEKYDALTAPDEKGYAVYRRVSDGKTAKAKASWFNPLPDGSGLIAKGPIKEIRLDGLDWQ